MTNIQYVTKEGLDKLRASLDELESKERPRISQQIAEARDKGDLSENAEYDAAKEAQGLLELKIAKLQDQIANARVIDPALLDHSKISILSKVKIKNLANNMEMNYQLVPETEADLSKGKISVNTPIAKGLLGKKIGEIADIALPNGTQLQFEVLDIKVD
ncbi:MAG TPA: transcription elongation factor GreA [Moheibacter sp.]|nr:transcription elongation factor GreA [Moheibacter sp.]